MDLVKCRPALAPLWTVLGGKAERERRGPTKQSNAGGFCGPHKTCSLSFPSSISPPTSMQCRSLARSLDQRPSNRPLSNAERPACLLLISRNYHVIFLVRLSGGGGGGGRIRSTSCGKAKAKGEREGQADVRDRDHLRQKCVSYLHSFQRQNGIHYHLTCDIRAG